MKGFLGKRDIAKLLTDLFSLPLYQKIQTSGKSSDQPLPLLMYTDNQAFWQDAMAKRHFQTMRVQLKHFHLLEWLPSAPGRYFTEAALLSRREADTDLDPMRDEYGLYGKYQMIQGGIGSFRLAAKRIDTNQIYFLGATSTGVSHEGIPVALTETDYQHVIPCIHNYGGCLVDLEGTLQILQGASESLNARFSFCYDPGIPRYCLAVDHLRILQPSYENLIVTAAIAFSIDMSRSRSTKAWSFYAFRPDQLNMAIDRLEAYARRHSRTQNPLILADFDEHYQHFRHSVEFPLHEITTNTFDVRQAEAYQHRFSGQLSHRFNNTVASLDKQYPQQRNKFFLSSYPLKRNGKPVPTFLCFAPEDKPLAEEFKKHLQSLQRSGHILLRSEDEIRAGEDVEVATRREIENAQLILFLLSSNFIADAYRYDVLLQRVLERHERNEVKAMNIYVRHVHYENLPLANLPLLPANAIPVQDVSWCSRDSAFEDITNNLARMIRQFSARQ